MPYIEFPAFHKIIYNRAELRDRVHACWLGKSIGGTLGGPLEGKRTINDVRDLTIAPGQVLPNDDLDLQLVWLRAMDEVGPDNIDEKVLGAYWQVYIGPCWAEYGIGKGNLRNGILPPMSGELYNDQWKHSNGAWIRTEIWATTHPGDPDATIPLALADACVDHGYGEGTYAAVFVAALQSAAFLFSDIRVLIDIALSKIPEDCRVARSIRLVVQHFDAGIDWASTREDLIRLSEDIGWFQAPCNVGYVILGLLYGGCDFKRSMLLAVNCGDDTDCTGATVGATLGIMYGTKCIPEDWAKNVGDDIVNIAIIKGHGYFPATCTELTNCVMSLLGVTMRTPDMMLALFGKKFTLTDGATDFGGAAPEDYMSRDFAEELKKKSPWSITVRGVFATAYAEYEHEPVIAPLGQMKLTVSCRLNSNTCEQRHMHMHFYLPDGWTAEGRMDLYVSSPQLFGDRIPLEKSSVACTVTLTAPAHIEAQNRGVIEITTPGCADVILIPLMIIG